MQLKCTNHIIIVDDFNVRFIERRSIVPGAMVWNSRGVLKTDAYLGLGNVHLRVNEACISALRGTLNSIRRASPGSSSAETERTRYKETDRAVPHLTPGDIKLLPLIRGGINSAPSKLARLLGRMPDEISIRLGNLSVELQFPFPKDLRTKRAWCPKLSQIDVNVAFD